MTESMTESISDTIEDLVQHASVVRTRAHRPYSRFAVGAALLDADGQVHVGCNVENASFGLTMCAERVAVGNALAAGAKSFEILVVVSSGAVPPCGACRQVLSEFCASLRIWLVDADDPQRRIETSLDQLFPLRFTFD